MLSKEVKEKLENRETKTSENGVLRALDLGGYVVYEGKRTFLTNEQAKQIELETGKKFKTGKLC